MVIALGLGSPLLVVESFSKLISGCHVRLNMKPASLVEVFKRQVSY